MMGACMVVSFFQIPNGLQFPDISFCNTHYIDIVDAIQLIKMNSECNSNTTPQTNN